MMNKTYKVAGYNFSICGDAICNAVELISGFKPFETAEQDVLFAFTEGTDTPNMLSVQYEFAYEDVTGKFGRSDNGYLLVLQPAEEDALYLLDQKAIKGEVCTEVVDALKQILIDN